MSETLPPVEALRAWLRLFVDHIATKQVMSPVLASMVGGPSELYAESGAQVKAAIALLVDRAVASGAIRLDIDPLDLLRALAGVAGISSAPGWEAERQASRRHPHRRSSDPARRLTNSTLNLIILPA